MMTIVSIAISCVILMQEKMFAEISYDLPAGHFEISVLQLKCEDPLVLVLVLSSK